MTKDELQQRRTDLLALNETRRLALEAAFNGPGPESPEFAEAQMAQVEVHRQLAEVDAQLAALG